MPLLCAPNQIWDSTKDLEGRIKYHSNNLTVNRSSFNKKRDPKPSKQSVMKKTSVETIAAAPAIPRIVFRYTLLFLSLPQLNCTEEWERVDRTPSARRNFQNRTQQGNHM